MKIFFNKSSIRNFYVSRIKDYDRLVSYGVQKYLIQMLYSYIYIICTFTKEISMKHSTRFLHVFPVVLNVIVRRNLCLNVIKCLPPISAFFSFPLPNTVLDSFRDVAYLCHSLYLYTSQESMKGNGGFALSSPHKVMPPELELSMGH